MYRIKYLLGILATIFSLVFVLFGTVGWVTGDVERSDTVVCFLLASVLLAGGTWLLVSSLRDYRTERSRLESVVRHLIATRGGRVTVGDVAHLADITEDDAREYLEQRSRQDVVFVTPGRNGKDTYLFGQEYWNN